MKTNKNRKEIQEVEFSKFTGQELADAYVFPSDEILIAQDKNAEDDFWANRRKQFENRSEKEEMYAKLQGQFGRK